MKTRTSILALLIIFSLAMASCANRKCNGKKKIMTEMGPM